jgi:Skp family chaperone for outer membrane proteins
MIKILALISFCLISQICSQNAFAQAYRYMDSSGNINFVDRPEQVPQKYRHQIPALVTPIVRLEAKEARKLEQERERKRKEIQRKQDSERQKREKEIKRLERERQKNQAKMKKSGKKPAEEEQVQEGDFSQVPEKAVATVAPAE